MFFYLIEFVSVVHSVIIFSLFFQLLFFGCCISVVICIIFILFIVVRDDGFHVDFVFRWYSMHLSSTPVRLSTSSISSFEFGFEGTTTRDEDTSESLIRIFDNNKLFAD